MDRGQSIAKARQFAETAFGAEHGKITREFQSKLTESLAEHAARGIARSGSEVAARAAINAEKLTVMLRTRLELLLEGFEMHDVVTDDQLANTIVNELTTLRSAWIQNARQAHLTTSNRVLSAGAYMRILESDVGMHPNEIKTMIDRRRFMPKKTSAPTSTTIYHVHGNNNRWLNNSQDHSVNVVTSTTNEIFANLRQEIESKIPVGDEQKDILERLWALEQAQNSPSFAQRYTEFIAAAANYVTLITPFIPALSEILHRHLS